MGKSDECRGKGEDGREVVTGAAPPEEDILQIAANIVMAKCENRQDDILLWFQKMVNHPHQGPAKEVFMDMVAEALGKDPEYYQGFVEALEEEVGE